MANQPRFPAAKITKRFLWRSLGITGVVVMTSVLLVASRINRAAHVANAAPSDAVVVLGCAVQPDGTPSPALRARIEEGVRVWRDTGSRYLLVTGGVGTYPPAEAVVMRQIAEAQGVPPSALIDDTTAHTTEGSAWMCSRIATRLGWKRVTLISDPWHLLRARHQFADYHPGLDVRQSPAVLSPTWTNRSARLRYTLRECVAVPVYFAERAFRG